MVFIYKILGLGNFWRLNLEIMVQGAHLLSHPNKHVIMKTMEIGSRVEAGGSVRRVMLRTQLILITTQRSLLV